MEDEGMEFMLEQLDWQDCRILRKPIPPRHFVEVARTDFTP